MLNQLIVFKLEWLSESNLNPLILKILAVLRGQNSAEVALVLADPLTQQPRARLIAFPRIFLDVARWRAG